MEKSIWITPEANEVVFAANDYFASSCGDSGTNYLFKCDAGGGDSGQVWLETNNMENCQTTVDFTETWEPYSADEYLGKYHACNITHETSNQNEFLNGWYRKNNASDFIKVLVWRGVNKDNIHCTTNLDINTWEIAKS